MGLHVRNRLKQGENSMRADGQDGSSSSSTSTVCVATTTELSVTEEEDKSGFGHTQYLSNGF